MKFLFMISSIFLFALIFCGAAVADTTLLTTGNGGNGCYGDSYDASITDDGRYIAFASDGMDLIPGQPTNVQYNIFLYDGVTDSISLITTGATGNGGNNNSGYPTISDDGRYIAFTSYATDLIPGQPTNGEYNIFLYDGVTDSISLITTGTTGNGGNSESAWPSISDDGRYVAFGSNATDLIPGQPTNVGYNIFLYDRVTGSISLITTGATGNGGDNGSAQPSISGDGRYIAFESFACDLIPGLSPNLRNQIYLYNRITGSISLITTGPGGYGGNGHCYDASVSADGRYIVFKSNATNLIPENDTYAQYNIFLYDQLTGSISLITTGPDEYGGNGASDDPSISGDGGYIAFVSEATNLVPGTTTNGNMNIFLYDPAVGTISLITSGSDGIGGNHESIKPSVSAYGRYVAFSSFAWDLIPGTSTNGGFNLFLFSNQADISLADALDNTLSWSTDGSGTFGDWFGQNSFSQDNADAAQSGFISDGEYSSVDTTVNGPGTLNFWWKVSSELNYDCLRFYDNANLMNTISGDVGWIDQSYTLGPGIHLIQWKYSKDNDISSGLDCGWVDQVTWTPATDDVRLVRTGAYYDTIQEALNQAIDDDLLEVNPHTYTENLTIEHRITLQATGNSADTTIQAANPNLPVINITSGGSGSTIQGFTITGASNYDGVHAEYADNCQFISNTITGNKCGLILTRSDNNTINNNLINNNTWAGICIDNSSSNTINGSNTITGNQEGIFIANNSNQNHISQNIIQSNNGCGISILSSNQNTIDSNTNIALNGVMGIFIQNSSNNIINANFIQNNGWTGICLDDADGNTINNNNNIYNNQEGIFLANNSNQNTIQQNNIHDNSGTGISIINSNENHIINTNISQNGMMGLFIQNSNTNTLSSNTVQNNGWSGICLDNASFNTINGANNVTSNQEGIFIANNSYGNFMQHNTVNSNTGNGISILNSSDNTITNNLQINNNGVSGTFIQNSAFTIIFNNTMTSNSWGGVILDTATNTSVSQNNFTSNPEQALAVNGSGNVFYQDNTGNHWSDWTTTNPRPIDGNENLYDQYPSTSPF